MRRDYTDIHVGEQYLFCWPSSRSPAPSELLLCGIPKTLKYLNR